MIWNIEFQFAALLLAFVVAGMCLGQRRLNFAAERAFTKLLVCVIICIVLDILSVFAINYRNVIGIIACDIVCKLYLLSITMVSCQSAWFAVAEIRYSFNKFWVNITAAPLAIEILVLLFAPIYIHAENGELYTYGIPVYATYGFCFLYIIATLVMVIVLREKIGAKRKYAIYFWMICWSVVAIIQLLNNQLLLVSFAMSLAIMYMYCKLENPEYHLDFATNVFNRKGFSMIMAEHLKYNEKRSVITLTVGDMNMVNEVFGTHAVEKIILAISEFADGIPNSTLFRIEDNLFCLSVEKPEEAEKALETIIKRFGLPWNIGGVSLEIGVSLSFIEDASAFNTVEDLEEVVHYFAREATKYPSGEVLLVNETELHLRQRNIEMQHALEWAFNNDSVEVYYQPIYNIKEGKFSSIEALARLRDENGVIIMPGEFVEFAEKNGMILRLGEAVFRKVCEFIQRTHIEEYGIETVQVNLSAVQCMQEELSRLFKNIMGEYQIPPFFINFEITETAAINSKKTIEKNMKDLIAYGASFSLDDYGSGYSNISYVVNLPLKIIKIDKLLADAYFTSEKVRIATESTIDMIHKLGLKIVVEGIETQEQYLAFKALEVEYIQGFYFSKPLPKDKLIKFIQEWL